MHKLTDKNNCKQSPVCVLKLTTGYTNTQLCNHATMI